MTEQELVSAIALAVPQKDTASATTIAKSVLSIAIGKVGRMSGVTFNRDWLPFTFTANDPTYKLGSDILQKYPNVFNVQELWFTDVKGKKIRIVSLDEFNGWARGGTTTGRPTVGTVHSSSATLEVYPIPDSAYAAGAYIKRQVTQLADIPTPYHDLIYTKAIEFITAAGSPEMAAKLAKEAEDDVKRDSLIAWDGVIVESDRPIRGTTMSDSGKRADSYNLTGE